MVIFSPVGVPGAGSDSSTYALLADVDAWVGSDALSALVSEFGGPAAPTGSLVQRLEELHEFSSSAWDFRNAGERSGIDPSQIRGDRAELVEAAARALGLVDPVRPERQTYDHIIALGGLVRGCAWRCEYASLLIDEGISARSFAALTGFRRLGLDELPLLDALGLPRRTSEDEVMEDAALRAFHLSGLRVVAQSPRGTPESSRYKVAEGVARGGTAIDVVVAPAREGRNRANTADTYEYWAKNVAQLALGDSILLVTTPIYVPYQHVVAVQHLALRYGCRVETVGLDHSRVNERGVPQVFGASHYLQEVGSAIAAMRQLVRGLLSDTSPD